MSIDILRRNLSVFDEEDLKTLFADTKSPQKFGRVSVQAPGRGKTILKFVGLFGLIFVLIYFGVNFNATSKKFAYFWHNTFNKETQNQTLSTPIPKDNFNPESTATLIIPKINVSTPIIWNVPEDQIDAKLLDGIVHYAGTALPGQEGNVFLTGHSSYYVWVQSDYKDVFALLTKLDPGDKIYIQYQERTFTYEVAFKKVVSPKDLSVLGVRGGNTLTLMTCVPIGTNLNRLIIEAKEI